MLQAWDFRPGSNFVLEMQRAATEAERTIAVLSPDYLAAEFTQPEWAAAFAQDPTGKNRILVPVRVRECNPEGLIPQIIYIDLAGLGESEAVGRLLSGLSSERAKPATQPQFPGAAPHAEAEKPKFPGALPPIWNVPHHRNPNFTGRKDLLDGLGVALTSEGTAALTQPQAIHGLGGVGKTQLAVEYAYRYAEEYDLVWWVPSEEPSALAATYAGLARALDLPEQDAAEQAVIIEAVKGWLDRHGNWLLVLDNAPGPDEVRGYLPQGATGHVLITSHNPNWGGVARPLPVETFPREESVEFLLKRTGQSDEDAAGRLAEALGDLPLALEQAGAYVEETGTTLANYLELFQVRSGELLNRGQPAHYPATVATTWEISLEQLSQPAADLMSLFSFLGPDDIPKNLLQEGVMHLPEPLAATVGDPLALNDAVAQLRRYSFIEVGDDGWSVHRLVQRMIRDRLDEQNGKSWSGDAVLLVNHYFPLDSDDVGNWPLCARLLPHALEAVNNAEDLQSFSWVTGRLLNQVGLYLRQMAQYIQAKTVLESALTIDNAAYGSEHANVAARHINLGYVLTDLGDFEGAREHFSRALYINQAVHGHDHPVVATSLSHLGVVLLNLGNLGGAFVLIQSALDIEQAFYGPDHPVVANSLNNLGNVLLESRDLPGARDHLQRALAITEATCSPNDPKLASQLNSLGSILHELEDLDAARDCIQRAVDIDRAAYGPSHPIVANRLNNLGGILRDQGDLAGARDYIQQAVAIFTERLGEDHPDTTTVRRNLESLGF